MILRFCLFIAILVVVTLFYEVCKVCLVHYVIANVIANPANHIFLYFLMSIYRRSINMTTIEFVNRERRAETCVYHDDFDGVLYHGFMAEMIHRTLKELEVI
jgi:hypothetical protein